MSFDFSSLITNRAQADVERVRTLAAKGWSGMTDAERAEWVAGLKGAYNASDLNRVTAAMDALKAKLEGYGYMVPGYQRIKVEHQASELPKGYSRLEYVESSGTQWCDTNFEINPSNFREVCFEIDQTIINGAWVSVSGSGTTAPIFYIGLIGSTIYYGNGAVDTPTGYNYDYARRIFKADVKNSIVSVSGLFSMAATFNDITASRNLFLCGYGTGSGVNAHSARIYGAKYRISGVIVRNLIPCQNASGIAGLYDTVSQQFFRSAGTEDFIAGGYVSDTYYDSGGNPASNFYNANGVVDVDYAGNKRSDLVYKNSDGTFTNLGNYNTLVYGQNFYGLVEPGSTYTFSCEIVDTSLSSVHLCMDCMKDGARYIDSGGTIPVTAGITIARSFVIPDGCTSVIFGIANPTIDYNDYVVFKNPILVKGLYSAEEIPQPLNDYTWYKTDDITSQGLALYLANLSVLRSVLVVMQSTPAVPSDMEGLTCMEANNIEQILLDLSILINHIVATWHYSGELYSGEV